MAFVRRQPLGPVLGITPFNFPFSLAIHKLAPAVASGNSFILKPPTATPLTGLILGEMLLEAGFPPEAISVVTCAGSKAEMLVSDPRIKFLSFTGSSEVGWHLKAISGRARTALELGGNAAFAAMQKRVFGNCIDSNHENSGRKAVFVRGHSASVSSLQRFALSRTARSEWPPNAKKSS